LQRKRGRPSRGRYRAISLDSVLHRQLHADLSRVADATGSHAAARIGDVGEIPLVEQSLHEDGELAAVEGQRAVVVLELPTRARIDDQGVVDMARRGICQVAVAVEAVDETGIGAGEPAERILIQAADVDGVARRLEWGASGLDDLDVVGGELPVRREDGQLLELCLRDEKPVERIPVVRRQLCDA
jgi:hypothetical protein